MTAPPLCPACTDLPPARGELLCGACLTEVPTHIRRRLNTARRGLTRTTDATRAEFSAALDAAVAAARRTTGAPR